jgi:hypothetical protein
VTFPFTANGPNQLTLNLGDTVKIHEEYSRSWYRGCIMGQKKKGIFPQSFVQLQSREKDPLIMEIKGLAKEWNLRLLKLYKVNFIRR